MKIFPEHNFLACVVAPRRSGKTTLICNLLEQMAGRFDEIYLIYPNYSESKEYGNLPLNPNRIFTKYKNDLIEQIYARQHKIIDKVYPDFKILIIIDDGLSEEEFVKMPKNHILNTIAVNGRHKGISLLLSSQTYIGLSTTIRNNCEYLILFRLLGNNLDGITNQFNDKDNKSDFRKLIIKHTEKRYHFIYLDLVNNKKYKSDKFDKNNKITLKLIE